MPTVSVHQAKTHLSRLLVQVEAGENIVIARNGKPVAKLVRHERPGERQFGALKGQISIDDKFFESLPEPGFAAWDT